MRIGEAQVGRGDAVLAGAAQHVAHDLVRLDGAALFHVAQDRGHGLGALGGKAGTNRADDLLAGLITLGGGDLAAFVQNLAHDRGAILARHHVADRSTTVIEEIEEEAEGDEKRKRSSADEARDILDEDVTIVKRFSAEANRTDKNHQDAMGAVDMGISEKSDKIAQKVMEIQRKVCS